MWTLWLIVQLSVFLAKILVTGFGLVIASHSREIWRVTKIAHVIITCILLSESVRSDAVS